jgi:hypothetical protein
VNREQLAHVLRAACTVAHDPNVLVLGSQSILGSFDEDELPPEATASIEADIAFLDDTDRQKADRVDGAIGELSAFHDTNGVYAEGVHVETAILPVGWENRLVGWDLESSHPASPRFLDPHDVAAAKLAAGRAKDKDFVSALIRVGLLDVAVIRRRASLLPAESDPRIGHHHRRTLNFRNASPPRAGESITHPRSGPTLNQCGKRALVRAIGDPPTGRGTI